MHASSRRSKYFRILGYRVRKSRVFVAAAIFLLGASGVGGLIYMGLAGGAGQLGAEEPTSGKVPLSGQAHDSILAEPDELQAILTRHRQLAGLGSVVGLSLYGRYYEGEEGYDVVLSSRTSEMIRKRLVNDTIDIVCVSKGTASEVRITPRGGETQIQSAHEDLFWYMLILEGTFFRLFDGLKQSGYAYTLLPENNIEEERRIVSHGPSGVVLTHYIDGDTGLERKRMLELRVNGELQLLELNFSDYRETGEVYLPYEFNLRLNGELRARIVVDAIQINPGLAPWLFALEVT